MGKNNSPEPDFEQPAHSTEWSGRAAGRPASRSASRFWPAGRPVGQPVFSRRPARFSAWLAGWPAGRLAVAARPGQPAAPLPSRRLTRARPATPLETRPAAGHIRAGLNSSRPSPPAARLAGSANGWPGRPSGWPGRPSGWPGRPAGWPAGFVRRPGRIWASAGRVAGRIFRAAQPDLGGRPAGFGGSASRFWGAGRPVLGGRLAGSAGRPAAHHLRLNHHLAGTGSYVAALVRLGKTRSARSNCRRQQLERTQRDGRGLDQKASTTDSTPQQIFGKQQSERSFRSVSGDRVLRYVAPSPDRGGSYC